MINVIDGYVAIFDGRYWVGCISGNKYCKKRRRKVKGAIDDAGIMYHKIARKK